MELIPLQIPCDIGEAMTRQDKELLQVAFAIAGKKIPLRHIHTLDKARNAEAQEDLLGISGFTEDVLLSLAKRFTRRSERAELERQECLARQGENARDHLGRANLLLVVSIAKRGRYRWGDLPLLDRIQEGNLRISMRAVDGFDPSRFRMTRFSTHAAPWIAQAIDRALKNQTGAIRRPVHVHEMVLRIRRSLQGIGERTRTRNAVGRSEWKSVRLKDQDRASYPPGVALARDSSPFSSRTGQSVGMNMEMALEEETAADARESVQAFQDRVQQSPQRAHRSRSPCQCPRRSLGLDGGEPKIQRQIGVSSASRGLVPSSSEVKA